MDEYLFFQQHKNQLRDNSSIISPRIFPGKASNLGMHANRQSRMSLDIPKPKVTFTKKQTSSIYLASPEKPDPTLKFDDEGLPIFPAEVELNEDTMQGCLKDISSNYTGQYETSGYPPKICTLIINELLNQTNKLKIRVMDLGCGKGQVGEYLKEAGFLYIHGIDCSKNMLQQAMQTNNYKTLDKTVFGNGEVEAHHAGKYDVVVSASMINNDGYDLLAFQQMLKYVKMGGFVIFTTKLNKQGENQYAQEINQLNDEQHWKFVTEHTFYRYDKLCGGKGKFSNKQVKIVAYQKTDHNEYLTREKDRLEMEAKVEQERIMFVEMQRKKKEDKLNRNQNERAARRKQMQGMAQAEIDAEQAEIDAEQASEQEKLLAIQKTKERKAMMMKKLKAFIENAMWIKLKALKKQEEERIEGLRAAAEIKRKAAVLARKQTILMKKVPYDSDEEEFGMTSPAFDRTPVKLLEQQLPA